MGHTGRNGGGDAPKGAPEKNPGWRRPGGRLHRPFDIQAGDAPKGVPENKSSIQSGNAPKGVPEKNTQDGGAPKGAPIDTFCNSMISLYENNDLSSASAESLASGQCTFKKRVLLLEPVYCLWIHGY